MARNWKVYGAVVPPSTIKEELAALRQDALDLQLTGALGALGDDASIVRFALANMRANLWDVLEGSLLDDEEHDDEQPVAC